MKEIQKFWKWFSDNENRIRTARDPMPKDLMDDILENLRKVDEGLNFEIGHDPMSEEVEFVITPEGDKSKADITRELIAKAPKLADWVFIAFRPAMGYDFKTEHAGIVIDPQKIWFLPLVSVEDPDAIGIKIGIEGYQELDNEKYLETCTMVLNTCIGEEKAMNAIQFMDVCELPDNPDAEDFIEFSELGEYIDWKKNNKNTHL